MSKTFSILLHRIFYKGLSVMSSLRLLLLQTELLMICFCAYTGPGKIHEKLSGSVKYTEREK